jgi:hypothetical protein
MKSVVLNAFMCKKEEETEETEETDETDETDETEEGRGKVKGTRV